MPPPIGEEEEDLNYHDVSASPSHNEAVDMKSLKQPEVARDSRHAHQKSESGQRLQRDSAPVLVISDILTKKVAPARTPLPSSKTSVSERRHMDKGKEVNTVRGTKRTTSPLESNNGPPAKRKRDEKRDIPCAYCVRRLTNDPAWACHDALVALNGVGSYTGHRCQECVRAHVSCQLIPPQADKPVQALLKAAADLVASPGARRGPLLAAYEATTGPALRAIGVVPGPRGVEKSEPASKKPSTIRSKPTSTRSSAHINTPHHDTTTKRSFPSAGPTDRSHVAQSQQQGASTTMSSAQPPHHRQEDAGGDHHLEKLERQALRRRKVEALESLAHTAALFLAEFMTYTKREVSRPSATAEPAGGGQENSVSSGGSQGRGTDHAASAAAMAANMFKPLTATRWSARASAENPLNGAESYGGESDSDSDSSVDDVLGINRPARDHDGNDTEVEGPGHSNVNDDDDEEEDATAAATAATTAAVTGRHQEDESEERNLQQRNVKSEDQ